MATAQRQFPEAPTTYATYENAEKKMAKVMEKLEGTRHHVRYVIAAQSDGRFHPVALLGREQNELLMFFIGEGVCTSI
jgi:hypothetical protein